MRGGGGGLVAVWVAVLPTLLMPALLVLLAVPHASECEQPAWKTGEGDGNRDRYRERVLDGEIAERLSAIGAVLIEGPKACARRSPRPTGGLYQMRPMSLMESGHSTGQASLEGVLAGRYYLSQIVLVDIQELDARRRRDPENIRRLLNTLARNVGISAKVTALAQDIGRTEGPVARAMVDGYLDWLSRRG